MRSCRDIEPQLILLIDGQLAAEDQAEVRAHLGECATCRDTVADLERLRAAAGRMGPVAPPDHVWLEVAGRTRLDSPGASAPTSPSSAGAAAWQWIGLAAALVLVTVGLYLVRGTPKTAPPPATSRAGALEIGADMVSLVAAPYEKAIAELEALANTDDGSIDPVVAAVVDENLNVLDVAIEDSRAALASEPDSEPARDSLFEAMRRKITVLQATVSLINEMRLGDREGAARAAESLGKES